MLPRELQFTAIGKGNLHVQSPRKFPGLNSIGRILCQQGNKLGTNDSAVPAVAVIEDEVLSEPLRCLVPIYGDIYRFPN